MADPAEKLVRMANQIASFFRSYSHEEAVAGIHDHIVSFWSPVMRRDIAAYAGRTREGIDPLVLEALSAPATDASPTHREAAGPDEVGEIGASDAG